MRASFCLVASAIAVLLPASHGIRGESAASKSAEGHLSELNIRLTMADGSSRTARIEGVGCSSSICSRTVIKAKRADKTLVNTWLDSIAAIRETTPTDALFVMKDGTAKRLSLISDFRVLYLKGGTRSIEQVDLARVRSVEFAPQEK